ncbi:unnamed protein product [Dracunculus medinensis]|uniref:Nuclear transport factor 2 n=1 Tax=Dracunculus medinensis TaxID=318479 RepID=A0A0N4UB78_DRAME|nr:unnamed protein product [Dracunculus medinensis]
MPITAVEDGTACSAADRFTKLYYDAQDRKRNKMNFLYVQDAQLVWNGQLIQGAEEIAKFWESLPNSSHTLSSIDCHALEDITNDSKPLVVLCVGTVILGAMVHAFTQTFILSMDDDKYKILSDRFRFID